MSETGIKEHPWQTILGSVPAKSNHYKIITINGHPSLGKTHAIDNYEKSFFLQAGDYRNLMIEGFFEVYAKVFYATMSPDLDNSLKCLLDCLQQCKAIKNDNRCVRIVADKFVDKDNPRIEFRLIEV